MKTGVQTDYVIEINTDFDVEQNVLEEFSFTDSGSSFAPIDEAEFIKRFRERYLHSTQDPALIWRGLFGHSPDGAIDQKNEQVQYLTPESCALVLEHYRLFYSGIDFKHLPSGFFLIRNPAQDGVRNVLHYSTYLALKKPQESKLAIVLSDKTDLEKLENHFSFPQSKWYELLLSKITHAGIRYCTKRELYDAFISFSNTLRHLGLTFYELPTDFLRDQPVNPIVLLGRWETILTQPHLKAADRKEQWQAIPMLSLTQAYGALRAITDYEGTERPCGFILPEMYLPEPYTDPKQNIKYGFIRSQDQTRRLLSIDPAIFHATENRFWRYLSYTPQCRSIEFYQKSLEAIKQLGTIGGERDYLLIMMIESTMGTDNRAENQENEPADLAAWEKFCQLINILDQYGTVPNNIHFQLTNNTSFQSRCIISLFNFVPTPNIPFLNSMVELYISKISEPSFKFSGHDPFEKLRFLFMNLKTTAIRDYYREGFFKGARFYFVHGIWGEIGLQKYLDLQYAIAELLGFKDNKFGAQHQEASVHAKISETLIPHLSTFKITEKVQLSKIIELLVENQKETPLVFAHQNFSYCMHFFNDAITQLDSLHLAKLYHQVNGMASHLEIINYLEKEYQNYFNKGYFSEKREELTSAKNGLNEIQKKLIYSSGYTWQQSELIINIESAIMKRSTPPLTAPQLNVLNDHFFVCSELFSAFDFTEFLERINSIKENMSGSTEELTKLIQLICQRRSFEGFNQIFFRNKIDKCTDVNLIEKFNYYIEKIKPIGKSRGNWPGHTIQEFLAMLVLNSDIVDIQNDNYLDNIDSILSDLERVVKAHPHVRVHLIKAYEFLPGKNTMDYMRQAAEFSHCTNDIANILQSDDSVDAKSDMLLFYSLLANFNDKPTELITVWKKISVLNNEDDKKFILNLVNGMLNSKNKIDGLEELVHLLKINPNKFAILKEQCAHPPYPELKTLYSWLRDDSAEKNFTNFHARPFGARRLEYAFRPNEFTIQREKFFSVDKSIYTDAVNEQLHSKLTHNRKKPIDVLHREYATIKLKGKKLTNIDQLNLLCLCIEMLARTTSQYDQSIPPKRISQELNTTQVMALYAMLVHPSTKYPGTKLISEIDTGEGKSRIMMILAACRSAMGKTVDFMTSDMPLAERDYLTYHAFFTALGVQTSLISLDTPKQLYQKGGVNFTDDKQLILLRNKSDIDLDPYAYLDEQEENRCLLLDEFDKFKHDRSQDSYNYASRSNKLQSYTWIYSHLVSYVRHLNVEKKAALDSDEVVEEFIEYISEHDIDDEHLASIAYLKEKNRPQLVTWLHAASTALNLRVNHDYAVTENDDAKLYMVRDIDGFVKYTRKVLVLDNGRPIEGSHFSDGVHQCLCAIENQRLGKQAFVIPPENIVLRSSYPVSFIKQYENGGVFSVSGTTRLEAPVSSKNINYEGYHYIKVPRQKTLRREDKSVWLAKDQKQQINFIKKCMVEKLHSNPSSSILLICKDDRESAAIFQALEQDNALQKLIKKSTRVHALTEKQNEANAIAEAGTPGYVTVSTTGMFSRGVDINAENLLVLCSYVPTTEDEVQIKGRTGRFGKQGEYRMVPNMADPESPLYGKTYDVHREVDKLQKRMTLKAAHYEEVTKIYADFLEDIHRAFFKSLTNKDPSTQMGLLETWQQLLGDMQKAWNRCKQEMLSALTEKKGDEFQGRFKQFAAEWTKNAGTFITDRLPDGSVFEQRAEIAKKAIEQQHHFFSNKHTNMRIQRDYDVADSGQARIYSSLFAQTRGMLSGKRPLFANYHAWKEGRGVLFPDLLAALHGDRPLFANLRATISRLIQEFNDWRTKRKQKNISSDLPPKDDWKELAELNKNDAENNKQDSPSISQRDY